MKFKLAKKSLTQKKNQTISIKEIEEKLSKEPGVILYLDNENEHKDLVALVDHFTDEGKSVHLNEAKYGLLDVDYVYEFWVV